MLTHPSHLSLNSRTLPAQTHHWHFAVQYSGLTAAQLVLLLIFSLRPISQSKAAGQCLRFTSLLPHDIRPMAGDPSADHEVTEGRYAATLAGVREAAARIAPHALVTPVRMPSQTRIPLLLCALTLG